MALFTLAGRTITQPFMMDLAINLENRWDNQLWILVLVAHHYLLHNQWHHTLYTGKDLQEQKRRECVAK